MTQPPQPPNPQVKVEILLAGGHSYTVYLEPHAPLLENLLKATLVPIQPAAAGFKALFQIPLNGGRSVLCFASEHLVGVVTEPAIYLHSPHAPVPPPDPQVLPASYVQLDHVLTSQEHQRLLEYVLQRQASFLPTQTSTQAADYRRSLVLHSFPEFAELLQQRIQALIPHVFDQLGIQPFNPAQIEAQLTAHNDGDFYKLHNDNGSPETASRVLTYVYYFYREPQAFSGGELILYDSKIENNCYTAADSFKTIEPRNNRLVFFLSRYLHEVRPIYCASKAFADSRFTINGWIRSGAIAAFGP